MKISLSFPVSKRTEVKHFDADFNAQWADSKFEQTPTSPNENGRYSDEASKGHPIFWLWAEVWHASLFPYRFPFAKNLRSCTIMIKSIRVMVIWFGLEEREVMSERKHPKIYLAASVQVAGAGFGERMGQHCRSGAWKHSYVAWSCSSPRPRNSWEFFGKNAAGVQCCDNVTAWLLWTGRCTRHAWHWWPGKTPYPKLSIANHYEESLHCTCNADDDDNEPPRTINSQK